MYYFYLGTMQLPVPPPKMTVKINNKNKTINLINEGEINILKTPGLQDISFDVLLPNQDYPFADYSQTIGGMAYGLLSQIRIGRQLSSLFGNPSFQPAEYFGEAVRVLKAGKIPVRLIITRMKPDFSMLFDTNLLVSVEACDMVEDAKNGFDLTCQLRLREYRPYGTKECEVTKDADGKEQVIVKQSRMTDRATPENWKCTKEKSVFEAVKLASGGSLNWRSVANLNKIANPLGVSEGTVLRLG